MEKGGKWREEVLISAFILRDTMDSSGFPNRLPECLSIAFAGIFMNTVISESIPSVFSHKKSRFESGAGFFCDVC